MNKILIFLISIFFYISQTYAGVVPGTIEKGEYKSSITCNTKTFTYSPSNASCTKGSVKEYNMNAWCGNYTTNTCTCDNSVKAVPCTTNKDTGKCEGGKPAIPNTCTCNNSVKTNFTCQGTPKYYYNYVSTSSNLSFTGYGGVDTSKNEEKPTYSSASTPSGYIKLTDSSNLGASCYKSQVGTAHIKPTKTGYKACYDDDGAFNSSAYYYVGGNNGICNTGDKKDNCISSFTQVDSVYNVQRNTTACKNPGIISAPSSSCSVEGLYAKLDTTAPSATISGGGANVFQNDDTRWCNIKKYRSEGYTYKADQNPGCEFYKAKNGTISSGQEDLLKGLSITIPADIEGSGIGEVQIVLGKCSYTYKVQNQDITAIITANGTWLKPEQKNGFTIPYSGNITDGSFKGQPGLLGIFPGINSRLDECLKEGKNSIAVLIKDMARSTSDGVTLSPNTGSKFTRGTINIDNSTSKLELSGDLSNTSFTGTPLTTVKEGFYGTVENKDIWRNFTLNGNIKGGEEFEGGVHNECKSFSGTLSGKCDTSNNGLPIPTASNGLVWTAPSGVNPTTGKFMQYKCDGLGPFPTTVECKTGCPVGKIWNPNTKKCEGNVCKAYVGGADVEIENGVNGVVTGDTCMAYCIPGHSVGCVVKEIKVACSGTFDVERDWELNCGDNSTANQWYKEKGRCGETEGINHWNGVISERGLQGAKEFFNEEYLQNCQWYAGTTDIKKCNDIMTCGYGKYDTENDKCIRNECGSGLVNGICGNANGSTLERYPSFNQACLSGMPMIINFNPKDGKVNWICDGKDGGTRSYCSANIKQESNMCILDAKLDCTLY